MRKNVEEFFRRGEEVLAENKRVLALPPKHLRRSATMQPAAGGNFAMYAVNMATTPAPSPARTKAEQIGLEALASGQASKAGFGAAKSFDVTAFGVGVSAPTTIG